VVAAEVEVAAAEVVKAAGAEAEAAEEAVAVGLAEEAGPAAVEAEASRVVAAAVPIRARPRYRFHGRCRGRE
jgi:hypothetical protein